jgi:hypothetical protein
VDWSKLVQEDKEKWRAVVKTVTNIWAPSNTVNFCAFREIVASEEGPCSRDLVSQSASYYDLLFCTGEQLGAVWIPTPSPHYVCTVRVFQNRQLRADLPKLCSAEHQEIGKKNKINVTRSENCEFVRP